MTSDPKDPAFNLADVDRLLGMADQFVENWVLHAAGYDRTEAKEREAEWTALRPKIIAAWRASESLLVAYARSQLRGTTDWEDVDTAFDQLAGPMQAEYIHLGVDAARSVYHIDDWRTAVAAEKTDLGFQDWLRCKAEEELL